jgi:hypothetical protein
MTRLTTAAAAALSVAALAALAALPAAHAYPDNLDCSRSIAPGATIMGGKVLASSATKLRLVKDGVALECGAALAPGDTGLGFELSGGGEQGLFLIEAETSLESEIGANWQVQARGSGPWQVHWLAQSDRVLMKLVASCRFDSSRTECADGEGLQVKAQAKVWGDPSWTEPLRFNYTGPTPLDWRVSRSSAGLDIAWQHPDGSSELHSLQVPEYLKFRKLFVPLASKDIVSVNPLWGIADGNCFQTRAATPGQEYPGVFHHSFTVPGKCVKTSPMPPQKALFCLAKNSY